MYFRYILRRLGQTVIVLFFISILAFALIRIAPGNPARMMLPDTATEEQVHAKEMEMGPARRSGNLGQLSDQCGINHSRSVSGHSASDSGHHIGQPAD